MKQFLKANSASIIASSVDYILSLVLNKIALWPAFISSVSGTVVGGVVNFLICRYWAFDANNAAAGKQVFRYILIWCGNLVLNTGVVYLLLGWGLPMIAAKIITSVTVAIAYNYPLQKNYVFSNK